MLSRPLADTAPLPAARRSAQRAAQPEASRVIALPTGMTISFSCRPLPSAETGDTIPPEWPSDRL